MTPRIPLSLVAFLLPTHRCISNLLQVFGGPVSPEFGQLIDPSDIASDDAGNLYVQAFNVSTGHRAIDYAASYGTPIRAVGDGTVIRAGWNGSYGNFVSIRHNETYTTNYAHQSKIAVYRGQKVKQGQTIGYVGSTGFSTGPHLGM